MKAGKKTTTNIDSAQQSDPPSTAGGDGDWVVETERRKIQGPIGDLEAAKEGAKDGDEGDLETGQELEDAQMEEAEVERTKLADGYYEIESVQKKRVRKVDEVFCADCIAGHFERRGWSEAENTWEPVENLLQCSDIIDTFEESLKAGRGRPTRKRKRKTGVTHVQTKKKQHQQQQRSLVPATYNVLSHVIRISEEPISFSRLNGLPCTNENVEPNINGRRNFETSKKVNENGTRISSVLREEEKGLNELDLKLCELKGATLMSKEETDKVASTSQEGQSAGGNTLTNGLRKTDSVDPVQLGRFTGAKKRKSGCVKRFKKDPASGSMDNSPNGVSGCNSLVPVSVQYPEFPGNNATSNNNSEDSRSMCTITQILRPISYRASISNNVQEVLLAFEAMRSDGTKVIVDNKFLKVNNPLLLIDFYEKNLRYNPI